MKKTLTVICLIIVLSMLLSTVCFADEGNFDTLADWNLKVTVPEGTTAVLKGNCYYIYAQKTGYIPYVMITTYNYDSGDKFISDFTAYMKKQYPDLKVASEAEEKVIGDKNCTEIDYTYSVSGYEVKDRRVIIAFDGITYMFASKEIEKRGETVGDMLEKVVSGCEFITEGPADLPGLEDLEKTADAFIYRQKNGMLKYWLDFTGKVADGVVLHCWFRSGEPTWYENVYILDLETADIGKRAIDIRRVFDMKGNDCSKQFSKLTLRLFDDHVSMVVKRDKKTLAGGEEDNILTGTYRMEPARTGITYEYFNSEGILKYRLEKDGAAMKLHAMFRSGDPEYYEKIFILDTETAEKDGEYTLLINKVLTDDGEDVSEWFRSFALTEVQGAVIMSVKRNEKTLAGGGDDNILTGAYMLEPRTYLLPESEGPYSEDELAEQAQLWYFVNTGFYPPETEAEKNSDGTVTIHLYEVVETDGIADHTATSAWYTVDKYGEGVNDMTGETVSLCR